jgi:hypothetical protein
MTIKGKKFRGRGKDIFGNLTNPHRVVGTRRKCGGGRPRRDK